MDLCIQDVRRRSATDAIAESLRRAILTGDVAGGTQLKQNEVAARFGASVVPVREAFQRLVAEGLVAHQPNRGVTVTSIGEADVEEIAEIRALLEPHALRLSARRMTAADLSGAETILRRAADTGDLLERAQLHWEFHRALYARADRPRLLDQLAMLYTSLNRAVLPAWSQAGLDPGWVDSHLRIVGALRAGDVEAACGLVVAQVFAAAERLRERLRGQERRRSGAGEEAG